MQTRKKLEEEIKTLKRLRITDCKDMIIGLAPAIMCGPEIFYVDKEPEIAIIAGTATLAGIIFSFRNIPKIKENNEHIKEMYSKMEKFNSRSRYH
jgi:predicted nuclease with TOPRIM domain